MRITSENSPRDPSRDAHWAWMHTHPADQGSAVLQDTEGRWPMSRKGGSWYNKSRARLGRRQGSLTGLLSAW